MPENPDSLRPQIRELQIRRRSLESKLLQPQVLLAASLIERHLGSGAQRRSAPAYYLSRSLRGRSRLTYLPKEALPAAQQQCAAHRRFQQLLTEWRHLSDELDRLWEQLRQSQSP